MVTLALAGPITQSVSLTAGKIDSAVGPGVGFLLTTVHPESGSRLVCVGTFNSTVGAGRDTLVAVTAVVAVAAVVGVDCASGIQAVKVSEASIKKIKISLRIHFSIAKFLEQFYQRKTESGW
jgi:hypothetical protein